MRQVDGKDEQVVGVVCVLRHVCGRRAGRNNFLAERTSSIFFGARLVFFFESRFDVSVDDVQASASGQQVIAGDGIFFD